MIRDNPCRPRLCRLANYTATVKGLKMRFGGYWVSAEQGNLKLAAGEFDDTALSGHSDWNGVAPVTGEFNAHTARS